MALPIGGPHHLAIRVTDLGRARDFYTGILGFQQVRELEGGIIVNANGTFLVIRGADAQTAAGDRFSPFRVGLDHLALTVPDAGALDALKRHLNAAGVPNNGIHDDAVLGGKYISFYDPDGIAWELFALSA